MGATSRQATIEPHFYIASDGTSYRLNTTSGSRSVLSDEGSGLPPIDYITQRGPFQHGESITDYFLRPRVVQYLIRQNFCSRQAAYDGRTSLLNAIRPNRAGGPTGTLRHILPGGSTRDLTVAPLEGPKFEPRQLDRYDEWSIQEVMRFIAHNPVYYNPVQKSSVFGPQTGQLTFPITFSIIFGGFDFTNVINYLGNWQEYPTFEIPGPAGPYIEINNLTTDEKIVLSGYYVPSGQTLMIAIAYGSQSIYLASTPTTSLLQYVTSDSDLASFHLEPGNNSIQVILRGAGALSSTMRYYERFIGV